MRGGRYVLGLLCLTSVNVLVALIVLSLYEVGDFTLLLWAPGAIGLAVMLAYGLRWWPGVLISTFVVAVTYGQPLANAALTAVVDVLEVTCGCVLLRGVLKFRIELDRVRDVVAFVAVAITTDLIGAIANVSQLVASGVVRPERALGMWSMWWWSHLSADLIVTPALLTLRGAPVFAGPRRAELIALCVLAPALVVLVLATKLQWFPSVPAPYYLLPILLWAGMRFGPRGGALASFGASVTGIVAHSLGIGPFSVLFDLQTFVAISAVSTLTLSALAVERLRAEQRRSAIMRGALDGIVTIDANGRVVDLNPAAEQLFAVTADNAIGHDLFGLAIPPRRRAEYREKFARMAGDADEPKLGTRYRAIAWRPGDGKEFPVEVAAIRLPIAGDPLFTGFIRDVSAEQRAEEVQREASEALEQRVRERTSELMRRDTLMRTAEELARLGSFDYDIETKQLEWSDELFRIFGLEPGRTKPDFASFIAAVHPADRVGVMAGIEHAIASHESFGGEERIVRPDGSVRVLQTVARVFGPGLGTAHRLIGCCQDITERKESEAARLRLVQIVEQSDEAIIGLTPGGMIESWNNAAANLFGYAREEGIGMLCMELVPAELRGRLQEILEAVRSGEHLAHYELLHMRRDRSTFEGAVSTSSVLDGDGHVIGISKVIRDVTSQKQIEQQLRASLREKEVLLREIHHRVKNNLQVIASMLNLQTFSQGSDGASKGLIESQSRIHSMALVHQLLYQSNNLALIQFSDYLRKLVDRLLQTYSDGDGRVRVQIAAPPFSLDIDRAIPCGLIVNELVTNALIHAFPHGERGDIKVTLEHDTANVSISVSDNGIGMQPPESFDELPTFGLQIAHTLSLQLDGRLTILPGEPGTIARVEFPFAGSLHR